MSGLLIRYDEKGAALRSVGDPPNGVLTIAALTGADSDDATVTFAIDGSLELDLDKIPAREGVTMVALTAPPGQSALPDHATPVSVAEVIDACASEEEIGLVIAAIAGSMVLAAKSNHDFAAPVAVEYLQAHVNHVAELREALLERGIIRRNDG